MRGMMYMDMELGAKVNLTKLLACISYTTDSTSRIALIVMFSNHMPLCKADSFK